MTKRRTLRFLKAIVSGGVLFQASGCDLTGFVDFLQTVFLAITAAGSIAILQNI